jgi:hypothetical protein
MGYALSNQANQVWCVHVLTVFFFI